MRLLTALRLACFIEAISFLVLLGVAMPLKYYAGMPKATMIAGSVHGGLFLLVLGLLYAAFSGEYLGRKLALWVAVGAVVPGLPFFVDHKIKVAQAEANQAGE